MVSRPRTSMYAERHVYSEFDPDEVHRDLRADPAQAALVLRRSSAGVLELHRDCGECARIVAEHAAAETAVTRGSGTYASLDEAVVAHSQRATKFVVTRANLARMLGLGRGEHISRMYVSDDPQLLYVIVAGEHYEPVVDGTDVPVTRMSPPPRLSP